MSDRWRPWTLYSWTQKRRPGDKPPPTAELSADGAWATLYDPKDGRTILAVWVRHRLPDRETFARAAADRRAREHVRLDASSASG